MLIPAVGHHATHRTEAWKVHVLMQRAVATSHKRTLPSSDPEASHWPSGVGQIVRTCFQGNRQGCLIKKHTPPPSAS